MIKSHTIKSWITSRGEAPDLAPRLSTMANPAAMKDRAKLIARVAMAIRKGEQICIFSDYDCDGLVSAAILLGVIRELGGRVTGVHASRFEGGYGLSQTGAEKVRKTKASLLITCDCGSSNHKEIAHLAGLGIETVVIDHHLVPEEPLPAVAFLNPHQPDCGFAYKWMCSAGLALSVAGGLNKELKGTVDVKAYLDLVAMATIADVMPLTLDNRAMVATGLEMIRQAKRPGIKALIDLAKLETKFPLTGRDIAWRISPMLNAPGRLGPPDIVVDLLLARGRKEAEELALELQRLSNVRRMLTDTIQEQALAEIEMAGWQHDPALVVGNPEWNHGIVGITAGRLVDKFGRPSIVVGSEGRGSVRGPAGYNLHTALTMCKDYLIGFGGHAAAAGVHCEFGSKFNQFRAAFCEAITTLGKTEENSDHLPRSIKLDRKDSLRSVLSDLDLLEPCGEGNPRPKLIAEGFVATCRDVKGHLSLEVNLPNGEVLKGFLPGAGSRAKELQGKVELVGDLRPTTFGKVGVEMFLDNVTQK